MHQDHKRRWVFGPVVDHKHAAAQYTLSCEFPIVINGFALAYCVMNAVDPLAACDKGGVTGSVAPNGASALVPDRSLSEKDADHDFRWVACGGGAGEVVVHLDKAEPPTGRCERTSRS